MTPSDRKKNLPKALSDLLFLDDFCAFIANGATPTDFCEMRELPFGDVMNWIHADPVRDSRYRQATFDRDEWFKDKLMSELKRIAFVDIRKAVGRSMGDIDDDTAKAISGITYADDGVTIKSVKMYDKLKAIEMAGKQIGLFRDKTFDPLKDSLEMLIAGSYEKKL